MLTITGDDTAARPGAVRRLHRAVEERGRRHGLHGRARRVGQAVRREAQGRDARRAADHRRVVDRRAGPGPGAGRRRPRTRTRACSGTEGETGSERWANKSALLQECVDVYEEATGDDRDRSRRRRRRAPTARPQEIYIAVTDFCSELFMFKAIAEKVGADLNDRELAGRRRRLRPDRPRLDRRSRRCARTSTQRTTRSASSSSTRRSGRAATGARSPRSRTPAAASARRATTGFGDNRRAYGASSDAGTGASGVAALDRAVVGAEVGRDDPRVRAHRRRARPRR